MRYKDSLKHLFALLAKVFSPIPEGKTKGWNVLSAEGTATIIDKNHRRHTGKIATLDLRFLVLRSKFGQLVYGLIANAWDQWAFFEGASEHEPSGVWVAIIANIGNSPHIGVIKEKRPLIEGEIYAIPHGFVDPGEKGHEAAIREMVEETGFNPVSITSLGFFGFNTAFFGGSVEGPHSDEGFLVIVKENVKSIKFGPKEAELEWIPLNDFIKSGYCCPSVAVAAKALTSIGS